MPAQLSRTTRMPYGMTNAAPRQTMGNAGLPDPTWSMMLALDFISSLDTSALSIGGGGTFASSTGVGGNATLTSGAVANTIQYAATSQSVFQITQGQRMFFKWQGSLDSLLGTIQLGFVASNTAGPLGVYITSTVTTGALQLVVSGAGGTTTVPFPANLALVAGTVVELGIEIDPLGNVFAFFNPTTGDAPPNTNGSIANGPVAAAYQQLNGALTGVSLPVGTLFAHMSVNPTTAAARTLITDFIVAAQHRGTQQV